MTREDEVETLKWARWLPHMTLRGQNIRGFVYNQRTRDQILTSIYSMIKESKLCVNAAEVMSKLFSHRN